MGLGKKILKTSPLGYAAVKAVERKNDPERQAAKAEADAAKQGTDAGSLRSRLKEAQDAANQKRAATMVQQGGSEVAKFQVGFTTIRIFENGTIKSRLGSGSIIGATARVDQAGSQRIFRDTRQAFLTIEGPQIAISGAISASHQVTSARKFAAKVNMLARQLEPPTTSTPATGELSIPDQIGKLAELRDKGVLTEGEFEAKKADLLDRM
jgi:Short C-terminal domain